MIFRMTLLITRVTAAVNPAPGFKKPLPGATVGPARAAAHTAVPVASCGFMMAGGADGIDGRGEGSEGDEFMLLIRLVIECVQRRRGGGREEEEEDLMKVDTKPLVFWSSGSGSLMAWMWSSGTLILVHWFPDPLGLVPWFWSPGSGPLVLVLWFQSAGLLILWFRFSGLDHLVFWFSSSSPLVRWSSGPTAAAAQSLASVNPRVRCYFFRERVNSL